MLSGRSFICSAISSWSLIRAQTGKTAIAVDTIINQKKFYEEGKPVYARELALLSAFYGVTADSLICREEKGRGV